MPDPHLNISFDLSTLTFDSCEITWDNCTKTKAEIIQQQLKIAGGMAMVVEHGPQGNLYSRLNVFPDTSLAIKLTNPMFNEIGSHSVPFKIPASSHNLKIFGFPGRVERYTEFKNREYPMYIYAEGLHILYGVLVVTSADPDHIECYFKSGNGDFWSSVRGKSLKDIDLGESQEFASVNDAHDFMMQSTVSQYPYMPFAMFPLVNIGMTMDFEWSDIPTMGYNWLGNVMVNYYDNTDPQNPKFLLDWCSVTPFLYLPYILDRCLYSAGSTFSRNFIAEHAELSRLVLFSNTSKFWKNNPSFSPPIPGDRPNKFIYSDYVNQYPINEFIEDLQNMFCAALFVNDKTKEARFETFKNLISDNVTVPIQRVASPIMVNNEEPFDSSKFSFDNDADAYHENDIKDFHTFTKTAPVSSFANLPTPGSLNAQRNWLCLVRDEDIYYRCTYEQGQTPEWKIFSRNIRKSEGEELDSPLRISSRAFTLPMYYGIDHFLGVIGASPYTMVSWPLAHVRVDYEYSNLDDRIPNHYTPCLLFYRGMQEDQSSPANTYPLGTFDVFSTAKIGVGIQPKLPDANISLQWHGPYGLIENFYKEYLQWKMAGPDRLEFEAWFDVTELAALDFSKKYAINNNHMFLDSVEFAITPVGVSVSKVTAYKI